MIIWSGYGIAPMIIIIPMLFMGAQSGELEAQSGYDVGMYMYFGGLFLGGIIGCVVGWTENKHSKKSNIFHPQDKSLNSIFFIRMEYFYAPFALLGSLGIIALALK